jgi:hypothetical protein
MMAELTRFHRTQANDMGAVRLMKGALKQNRLCKVDPFSKIYDPYEVKA